MSVISMKQLLEAGVHFGHQTRRWNPKMKPYIYTERNGIYIIDLQKTVGMIDDAYNAVGDIAAKGVNIPVVRIDEAMDEKAAEIGHRIELIATVASTVAPSERLLKRKIAEAGISTSASMIAARFSK